MNSHQKRKTTRQKQREAEARDKCLAELYALEEARKRTVIMIGGPMAGEIFRSSCSKIMVPGASYPFNFHFDTYRVRRVRFGTMSWFVGQLEGCDDPIQPVQLLCGARPKQHIFGTQRQ